MNDVTDITPRPTLTVIEGGADDSLDIDDPEMDDLIFIARRLVRRSIDQLDFSSFYDGALDVLLDEADQSTVKGLLKNIKLHIEIPGFDYEDVAQ